MLTDIIEKLNKESSFLKFKNEVENKKNVGAFGLNFGEKIAFLTGLKNSVVFVANSFESVLKADQNFKALNKKTFIITENLCQQILNEKNESAQMCNYCSLLANIILNEIEIIICTPNVLTQKLLNKELFNKTILNFKIGKRISQNELSKLCCDYGYKRVQKIENKGEYAFRGDVFELFLPNCENPIRLDFFDDEIESIKFFDIENYQTIKKINSFYLFPSNLLCKTDINKAFDKFLSSCSKVNLEVESNHRQAEIIDKLNNIIETDKLSTSLLYLLPFMEEFNSTFFDYLPNNAIISFEDVKVCYEYVQDFILKQKNLKELVSAGELVEEHLNFCFDIKQTFKTGQSLIGFQSLYNANKIFVPEVVFSFNSISLTNYAGNYAILFEQIEKLLQENNVLLLCESESQIKEISNEFYKKNKPINIIKNFSDVKLGLNLIVSNFSENFMLPDEKLAVISFGGKTFQNKIKVKNVKDIFLLPKVGDYVVHDVYGIGKCKAIERLKFSGYEKDYIILEYSMGDKLFLPIEQASLISAYAGGSESPKLNRLGTDEFAKMKNRVKASVKEMAINLLELYAKREHEKGVKFEKDDYLQHQFEKDFKYIETPDQLSAINDIKQDMQQGKVMDRLLCGDVGYGKTEVALRTAFKTVQGGFQVAVLVPTTILSFQHYNTFCERMKNYGVNVQLLNRFKNSTATKEILLNLADGKVDVIIGTHKLLGKNVKFKNLGLLILDEEQRFGVEHKEKIKTIRKNINVLSMSATPIPRTLHMSMVGIRDISLITTAPKGRLPIQTIVTEFSFPLLKNAIETELQRNGQVLIVYNKIETIFNFAQKVKEMFPSVEIGIAHGRMEEKLLENTILKVFNGETKILIATTLIENGIDLPNANTMIVINADKLGLSQLYQLRGRVGRSNKESFAYLTYAQNRVMTEDGNKRLLAMGEFSELGSGFKIAMKDLEIRGAGNVLGKEQHGHIEKVGYDMYCKLLDLSVKELKGEIIPKSYEVKLEIALDCFIPNNYIESTDERFKLFNSFCEIEDNAQLEIKLNGLKEVYSSVPKEIENLAKTIYLRNLCLKSEIKRVVINNKKCFIEFVNSSDALNVNMAKAVDKYKRLLVLNFSDLPIIEFNLTGVDVKHKLDFIIDFLNFSLQN